MMETVVTDKGTTTIPNTIRKQLGLAPGTVLQWSVHGGVLQVRKKEGSLNEFQRHLRQRAGLWDSPISGKELLRRTRP